MIATSAKRKRLTHSTGQKLSNWIISSLDLVYLDKNRGQEIKSIEKRFFPMKLRGKLKVYKAEIIHLDWKNWNFRSIVWKKTIVQSESQLSKLQDWNRGCVTTFLTAECLYEERSTCSLNYPVSQILPGSHLAPWLKWMIAVPGTDVWRSWMILIYVSEKLARLMAN